MCRKTKMCRKKKCRKCEERRGQIPEFNKEKCREEMDLKK